jgi:hypothetical protein
MKNFKILAEGLDTSAAKAELEATPLWDWLNIRKLFPGSSHTGVHDIIMRGPQIQGYADFKSIMHNQNSFDYFPVWHLSQTLNLMRECRHSFDGEHARVGRIMVTRLDPGARIDLHTDEGGYAEAHDRYHIVVDGGAGGCIFNCSGELLDLQTGMLFWFNHQLPHYVVNKGIRPRTNIIFDVRREGK